MMQFSMVFLLAHEEANLWMLAGAKGLVVWSLLDFLNSNRNAVVFGRFVVECGAHL
jgi:hypothetical protein